MSWCVIVACSDDYLVRVKAQVMTRDDSTDCWLPVAGGGMSIVGLRKLVLSTGDDPRHQYLIHGERIADQSVSIPYTLKPYQKSLLLRLPQY